MSTTNPGHGHTDPASPHGYDDHGRAGPPSDAVIKRGYEEDGYDTKSVVSVPILVVLFFVLAFVTVTIMFSYFRHTPVDPMANPQTVEDNSRPLGERIAATPARGRPEPLKILDANGADPRTITRTPVKTGNSPEYHPEDIRPSPENTPTLFESGWVVPGQFARVPLEEAKAAALKGGKLLKAREHPIVLPDSSTAASGSSAGRGVAATKGGNH